MARIFASRVNSREIMEWRLLVELVVFVQKFHKFARRVAAHESLKDINLRGAGVALGGRRLCRARGVKQPGAVETKS